MGPLADSVPRMADRVTAVANVLTRGEWRSVYGILCGFRDAVYETLGDRYGDDIFEAIPDCRRVIWRNSCELLRFDLDHTDLLVGLKGQRRWSIAVGTGSLNLSWHGV